MLFHRSLSWLRATGLKSCLSLTKMATLQCNKKLSVLPTRTADNKPKSNAGSKAELGCISPTGNLNFDYNSGRLCTSKSPIKVTGQHVKCTRQVRAEAKDALAFWEQLLPLA